MKKRELEIFFELLQNSRKSDREIAKKLKTSQPTITRIRKKLEKNIIKKYTLIPSLPYLGIKLVSFNFGMCQEKIKKRVSCLKDVVKLSDNNSTVLFKSHGHGMRKKCIVIAFHTNYRAYADFIEKLENHCESDGRNNIDTFLVIAAKEPHNNLDFTPPIKKTIENDFRINNKKLTRKH